MNIFELQLWQTSHLVSANYIKSNDIHYFLSARIAVGTCDHMWAYTMFTHTIFFIISLYYEGFCTGKL